MHRFFHDKHLKALEAQFTLGMTARSEKVRADALHQFIQNTRNPMLGKPTETDVKMLSESRQLLDSITNAFRTVRGESPDSAVVDYPQSDVRRGENTPNGIFTTSQNPSKVIEVTPHDMPKESL